MVDEMKIHGLSEEFLINILEGDDSFVYTFTKTYDIEPTVIVELFGKRIDSIVVTLTNVTITLLDTDGIVDGKCKVVK